MKGRKGKREGEEEQKSGERERKEEREKKSRGGRESQWKNTVKDHYCALHGNLKTKLQHEENDIEID